MKAIVQDKYGSPDVLSLEDIDQPEIGDDDVLVRVRAVGVDPGIWHLMTGLPYLIRIMGYGLRTPKTRVPGTDVGGTVEAVGNNVTQFGAGDEVFGGCQGALAEYACGKADKLTHKPEDLTFEQAAVVTTSALTALQGLRDHGNVQAGQKVLIIGASGGVGTFAVQLAKVLGAGVTGVCSTTKIDMVRSIGADDVIDYKRDDFAQQGQRYDVIFDTGGNSSLSDLRRALTPRGTLVIVGGEGGGKWMGGTDRQLRGLMLSPFVRHNLRSFVAVVRQEDMQFLKEPLEAGKVTPVLDRTYSLSDAPDAIRYLAEGHARGKVAITV